MSTKWALVIGLPLCLLAGCSRQGPGERCDTLNGSNDCDDGLACISKETLRGTASLCCPAAQTGPESIVPGCTYGAAVTLVDSGTVTPDGATAADGATAGDASTSAESSADGATDAGTGPSGDASADASGNAIPDAAGDASTDAAQDGTSPATDASTADGSADSAG